jgi:2-oxo-4-hydroxy-4-carboxy-5-ureidoimidazoline decarboxylase
VIRLHEFNALDDAEAAALLRPCLDVDRWVASIVDSRPYASADELFATARAAASPFTGAELEAALAHHPRIGEQARGGSAEAGLSRSEQAGLALDDDVQQQLTEGNRAYETRFGRVFLIRAAGRSSTEILDKLQTRLGNDPDTEDEVVADQLRQIALVRLAGVVSA